MDELELVFVTGMSGAGKSTALKMLEDMGYFCVDNLPVFLIGKMIELTVDGEEGRIHKVAMGVDIRSGSLTEVRDVLRGLREKGIRYKILFLDATDECVKVTNNNRLTQENISHIVDAFTKREDVQYFCRLVSYDEVKDQNYNLSVSTYVEAEDKREKIDIKKLNAEIKTIVAREQVLRDEIDKIIAEIEEGRPDE